MIKTLTLGYAGEYGARMMTIDLSEEAAMWPDAAAQLLLVRPGEHTPYPADNAVYADGCMTFTPTKADMAIPGQGYAQVYFYGADGNVLGKSSMMVTHILSSLGGESTEPPSGDELGYYDKLMQQAALAIAAGESAKEDAQSAAESAAKAEAALEEMKNISTQSGNMPDGGSPGQILAKKSAENYDTHWIDPPSGSGTGGGVADSVAWGNVTDKPSTYPPAAHTHPEYLGKNETAANAASLNGKSADQYALKSELPNVPVQSVNGKTGAVSLSASDVGALSATAQAADSAKLGGKTWAERMLEIYPVGRIYISVNETSPASLFGGTWEQIKDCFLLGAGGSYELGSTGGEATHKLTEDELPALRGTINVHGGENGSNYWNPVGVFAGSQTVDKYIKVSGSTLTSASSITGLDFSAGNDMPHNNMPPWKAVNIWKRVA